MSTRRDWMKWMAAGSAAGLPWLSARVARAAGYPDKPIKIIVPFPAGGFNDTLGRIAATYLQGQWKQTAVVDNRAGGSTIIGTQAMATAAPDGYTLGVAAFQFAVNPLVYTNLPYDTKKAFVPIVLAGRTPLAIVVPVNSPLRSVADVIKAAKDNPGKLNYCSSGIAGSNHLAMELFCETVGVRMNHVPYKGGAPAMADLAGGQVDLGFELVPNAIALIQGGKLRALAVSDPHGVAALPGVPTVAREIGKPFDVVTWHGFVAPAGTPKDIVQKLNEGFNAMLKLPETRKAFADQGVVPAGGTPQALAEFIDAQTALYRPVVLKNNIRVE
jgi:tripartite-type tricarboxylate transporter receptor subunit TctC